MGIAIISSLKDKASINIKENLVNKFNFNKLEEQFDNKFVYQCKINNKDVKLYTIGSELIYTDNLDKKIGADLFIFISRHSSKEERKSLTVHVTGNFGKAEHGGKDKILCTAPAVYMKNILTELNKNSQDSGFEATMEATHHGPFLEKPVLFVEIGSSEKEWTDRNAGNIIAKSVINAIKKEDNSSNNDNSIMINNESINKNFDKKNKSKTMINNKNSIENNYEKDNGNLMNGNKNFESVFVIGGSHYNHVANKAMLETGFAVGHICAKYNLGNLNLDLIKEAMEKTIPKAKLVLLDWKGLAKEKHRIVGILEKNKIMYKRSDKIYIAK